MRGWSGARRVMGYTAADIASTATSSRTLERSVGNVGSMSGPSDTYLR